MKKKNVAARVKIFLVTRISGNTSVIFFGLTDQQYTTKSDTFVEST